LEPYFYTWSSPHTAVKGPEYLEAFLELKVHFGGIFGATFLHMVKPTHCSKRS